jgi:pimeloyl-ACP methyl ester carboxylesterase
MQPGSTPVGTVILLHGFTRSPSALDSLSGDCVELGARVLRPRLGSLWWPRSTNNARHLAREADRLRGQLADGPVVVAGHSAGAAAGAWIAGVLIGRGVGVSSLVMIDGVDSPTRLIRRAWSSILGTSVRAVCAPPSRCNRNGALAAWLATQSGDVETVIVPGAGHGDIEGPTGRVYRWACGDDPRQPAAAVVRGLARTWIGQALGRP